MCLCHLSVLLYNDFESIIKNLDREMSAVIGTSPIFKLQLNYKLQLSAIAHTPDHMTECHHIPNYKWVWLETRPVMWFGKELGVKKNKIIFKIISCIAVKLLHWMCSIVNTIVALC